MKIDVYINEKKYELEIPQGNLTKEEVIKKLYYLITIGKNFSHGYEISNSISSIFLSPKEDKDILEIEKILEKVQKNGLPYY